MTQDRLAESDKVFLEKYKEFFAQTDARRTALIYLDDDALPELLILKDGEYHLYFFDGSGAKAVELPDTEMKANAYGVRYDFERLNACHAWVHWCTLIF